MGMEHEIKLSLPTGQVGAATQWLIQRAGGKGRTITLENSYYDTPSLTLARAKSAVRVRRTPDGWLQTYKTVGTSSGGLHSRHEWEMPIKGNALEIDALLAACDDEPSKEALRSARDDLIPLFSTNFSRTSWHVRIEGADVEAAIDQGEVVAVVHGETRRAPICEIELELKHGDAGALNALSAEIAQAVHGLRPDDVSKAQRGYRLREGGSQ
ncbi:CYTH domain-containing protein [Paraburkholderia steynii]|uniref:CYTH domain-containing protein n=1 Tax=Paraburkholderia steynii TaxID=1245441 RepID=A0A7Z7FLU7_9BURK|nr:MULTISPECIES: CYTH domain-containing protein [Paraburkholderia]BDC39592.1 CYTH domain-containing protein [Paraburkholderia terrae]SDI86971.1 CYTH domain-containing protein [Paraburkholderia steynii]